MLGSTCQDRPRLDLLRPLLPSWSCANCSSNTTTCFECACPAKLPTVASALLRLPLLKPPTDSVEKTLAEVAASLALERNVASAEVGTTAASAKDLAEPEVVSPVPLTLLRNGGTCTAPSPGKELSALRRPRHALGSKSPNNVPLSARRGIAHRKVAAACRLGKTTFLVPLHLFRCNDKQADDTTVIGCSSMLISCSIPVASCLTAWTMFDNHTTHAMPPTEATYA
mmetsp:Transcript_14230/g.28193  ORF Transcript_14230/g.28193 Transcript_14230/m.28193 type:complete len:226 (-) Transcript_14230:28-705(-)